MRAAPSTPSPARRWLREPLLHFALLGAALFALHRHVAPVPPSRRIVLTADVVRGLREDFTQRNGAPPSPSEEQALLQRYIDAEVLCRRAIELGLDRGDVIVRRRLIQKMEFLNENSTAVREPSDAELETFAAAHPRRYALPALRTIEHVFVSADRHAGDLEAAATGLRQRLDAGESAEDLGEPFLRGHRFTLQSEHELASIFGASFAAEVFRLQEGTWSAPLRSSYGLHLVRVERSEPEGRRPLAEMRDGLRRDWIDEQRGAATSAALQSMRADFDILVEDPGPSGTTPRAGSANNP